jgi:hypothetical protein
LPTNVLLLRWDTKPAAHQGDVPTSCIDTQNVFLCRRSCGAIREVSVDDVSAAAAFIRVAPPTQPGWDHAVVRSRLRKLHIDGREYVWKADVRAAPGPDGRRCRCIRIRIWGGGKTSCALQADVTERSRPAQAEESYPYPTASDVHALIDHGLRTGWDPATRGGTFQVTSGADVTLPGFVLTDLLWAAEERRA